MLRKTLLSVALLTATFCLTLAHEFWIYPTQFFVKVGEQLTFTINVGEDYMGERWGGGSRRVERLRHISTQEETDLTAKIQQDDSLVTPPSLTVGQAGTHIVALETNSSFIELEPKKFLEYLKEDGLTNAISYRQKNGETQKNGRELYRRCAKTLVQVGETSDANALKNTGMALEIIPLTNPYSLPKGQPLACQFLFEGKPLKNALVRCWRRVNGKTELELKQSDAQGKATFDLPRKAKAAYMVSVVTMQRLSENPRADWQSTWGSMTFGMK
ncbi:MAG: DUF4198 domain-containing protein [Spirosomaceae bacterium]|jgi:uncharacterized GH25 family protein|nr:DUF4198 domain-containing protein [Spirosomataceae bacterium]